MVKAMVEVVMEVVVEDLGVQGKVLSLPAGFTQRVALVPRRGIAAAYAGYGEMVTATHRYSKFTLDDDILNKRLSYWTDNVRSDASASCRCVRSSAG